jgi:carboxyl-terminal processing protease
VRVKRERVEIPVVESRMVRHDGLSYAHVTLSSFTSGAHGEVGKAVRRLIDRGARGVVLDLRNNGGGLLQEAVLTASVFLREGEVVVSTRSRAQGETVYEAEGGNLPQLPVVVLIDRGTASAAEILAAALADAAGAEVVGTRSFGKGVFQQEVGLSNGGALKLTVGEYFTPDGTNLAGKGIRPDVGATDAPATPRDEALGRALRVLAAR